MGMREYELHTRQKEKILGVLIKHHVRTALLTTIDTRNFGGYILFSISKEDTKIDDIGMERLEIELFETIRDAGESVRIHEVKCRVIDYSFFSRYEGDIEFHSIPSDDAKPFFETLCLDPSAELSTEFGE